MSNAYDVYRDSSRIFTPADLAALNPSNLDNVDTPSTLAAALLMVPDVHNEERLSTLWGIAAFPGWNYPDAEGNMGADGSPFDAIVESLSTFDDEELLTQADLITEVPGYAREVGLAGKMAQTMKDVLDEHRAAKIITLAAQADPNAVTAHQVLATALMPGLDLYPGAVAALREAGYVFQELDAGEDVSPAVVERTSQQLEMMEMLGTPADALCEMALNVPGCVSDDRLGEMLSGASPYLVANWLVGRHRTRPTQESIKALAASVSQENLDAVLPMFNRLVEGKPAVEEDMASGSPVDCMGESQPLTIPWIGLVAEHLFLPAAMLTPPNAALLWGRLTESFGDDGTSALALCIAQANGSVAVKA